MTLKRKNLLHYLKCLSENDSPGRSMDLHQDEAKELMGYMTDINADRLQLAKECVDLSDSGGYINGNDAIYQMAKQIIKDET